MRVMIILATVLSIIPIITSCFMPNWYLGDKQNAVDDSSIDEESVVERYGDDDSEVGVGDEGDEEGGDGDGEVRGANGNGNGTSHQ